MTFLTILGVTEILCSFRLVLEGKTVREIPESSRLEFLEKFSTNSWFFRFRRQHLRGVEYRRYSRLPLRKTLSAIHQKSWEPSFWEAIDSFFSSLCKFGSLKNPFATISSLCELYFRFRLFIFLVQTKKFLWAVTAAQAVQNHGDEWGLTWFFWWGHSLCRGINLPSPISKSSLPITRIPAIF